MQSAVGAVMAALLTPDWFSGKVRETAFSAAMSPQRQRAVPMALMLTIMERLGFLPGDFR